MMRKLSETFGKIAARRPEGPALLRAGAAVAAAVLALWALGVALTLVFAALVAALALAAGVAAVALAGELVARWKPEVARQAAGGRLRHPPVRSAD